MLVCVLKEFLSAEMILNHQLASAWLWGGVLSQNLAQITLLFAR